MPKIPVDQIRTDGHTQSRAKLDEATAEEYGELYAQDAPLPAVDVFSDGSDYWLADGFHRVRGCVKAQIEEIEATIHQGSRRDALLFGMKRNTDHGLRRSKADKRFVVEMVLDDPEWGKWSIKRIAEECAVSWNYVKGVKTDRESTPFDLPTEPAKPAKAKAAAKPVEPVAEPVEEGEPCPNCGSYDWNNIDGWDVCAQCDQTQGEPVGDVDEAGDEKFPEMRKKALKQAERLVRAIDDLHHSKPKRNMQKQMLVTLQHLTNAITNW